MPNHIPWAFPDINPFPKWQPPKWGKIELLNLWLLKLLNFWTRPPRNLCDTSFKSNLTTRIPILTLFLCHDLILTPKVKMAAIRLTQNSAEIGENLTFEPDHLQTCVITLLRVIWLQGFQLYHYFFIHQNQVQLPGPWTTSGTEQSLFNISVLYDYHTLFFSVHMSHILLCFTARTRHLKTLS